MPPGADPQTALVSVSHQLPPTRPGGGLLGPILTSWRHGPHHVGWLEHPRRCLAETPTRSWVSCPFGQIVIDHLPQSYHGLSLRTLSGHRGHWRDFTELTATLEPPWSLDVGQVIWSG